MNKTAYSLFLISLFISSVGQSQVAGDSKDIIVRKIEAVSLSTPPEIAYIQTSKDIYETGEDLWFKVYFLNSHTLSPSLLSKTLYLQLVNEKTKKPVWQEKYGVSDGFSDGRVLLKEDMDEGDYLIEAFSANSFFADSSEFTAVRKVKVVKDITHIRYLRAKFEKQKYSAADSIKIKLIPVFQKDTSYIDLTINLRQGEEVQKLLQTKMILSEDKELSFKPQSLRKGSSLVINSKYKDHSEELILPVPCSANPVQFNVFPEGGSLISGIKSRVAFKAVNINGEPVNVSGTIYKNDSTLLEFNSTHDGMGSFYFTPIKDAKYYIRLKEPITDSIYSFPEIEPEGKTLRLVSRDKDYLNFIISKNTNSQPDNIYLLVQVRGIIYGLTEAKIDKDLKIKVPLADIPQGIAEVTLFNDKMTPVAERLVYVNPEKKLKIRAVLADSIVQTRGKVNLKIITRDENNIPVRANLGLTVFDKLYENPSDSVNILSHVYLSTQIKGRIYNPGYYFNEKNIMREPALDLLLLTQGWRKYIWNEANLNKSSSNREIISDGIEGNALAYSLRKDKTPKDQVFIMAFSPEKDSIKKVITVDNKGSFTVNPDLLSRWAGHYIYLRPLCASKAIIKLKFMNPFDTIKYAMHFKNLSMPLSTQFNELQTLETHATKPGTILIKDVVIKGTKTGLIRGKYLGGLDSLAKADFDINTDYVCRFGWLNCHWHRNEPDNRKPIEGEKVKVAGDSFGWVIYHHIPRKYTEEELFKLFNLFRIVANYAKHEFYQPNYDKEYDSGSIPDYRNTLLWAPSIITDEKGEANISFFCSDYNIDFVGRIDGVGENLLGSGYFKLTVRKLEIPPNK